MNTNWGTLTADEALACLAVAQRELSAAQAKMVRAMARLNQLRQRDPTVADEISLELHVTRQMAAARLELADALVTRLPCVLAEIEAGNTDLHAAAKIHDATSALPDEKCRDVDAALAPRLAGRDATQIRRAARDLVHRIDPEGSGERAAKRREDRSVRIVHEDDAMASLTAYLPAEVAAAGYSRIDRIARHRRNGGDERTLDQLRADTLSDLVLGTERHEARATVFLHVPIGTALGVTERGAFLEGHGPIPGTIARGILNDPASVWKKVLTDPASGAVLDVGRKTRRPPAAVRDLARARDRECGVAHCHRPAHHSQLDHVRRWRHQGQTSAANLHALCAHHNRLREKPGWDVHFHDATGETTITTPAGRSLHDRPEPLQDPGHPKAA
ncbi:HNH endonuclease signature motif containing protein [Amycolatopsis acidicola]|uniref:HNH endonuclease signature motif containing protein n=1 Tax=Amycolatopsis acidicola TaxID=2596893 RepID=UPI0014094F38|nr:HNH endonuclease signature motif containing protein [Amycolatopsis acidicola]